MKKRFGLSDLVFLGTFHKNDNYTKLIAEPVAIPVSYLFLQIPGLTPNVVTLMAFILGLISAVLAWKGIINYSAIFYYLTFVFDFVDGKIARTTGQVSALGYKWDYRVDRAILILMSFSYISLFNRLHQPKELMLLVVYVFLFLYLDVLSFTSYIYQHMRDERVPMISMPERKTKADVLFLIHVTK